MHNNGVTHTTVCDDFEGVYTLLQWLSYMPKVEKNPIYCTLYLILTLQPRDSQVKKPSQLMTSWNKIRVN